MTSLLAPPPLAAITGTSPRRDALQDLASAAPGIAPFGLMIGVIAVSTGLGGLPALLGGVLIFGGSAQLAAFTSLGLGSGLVAAVLSGAVVNARLVLYGAAIEERFRGQPGWYRTLATAAFLQDQTFLAATARPTRPPAEFRIYWSLLGGGLLGCWTLSILVGVVAAPWLPPLPHLGLLAVALFVTMLATRVQGRDAVRTVAVAGCVAALTLTVAPTLAILLGTVAGVLASVATQRKAVR